MKTRKEWERSDKQLDEFLNVGDRIDEAMFNYLAEVVSASTIHRANLKNMVVAQNGEPMFHDESDISWHQTALSIDDKYYFVGCLPKFE